MRHATNIAAFLILILGIAAVLALRFLDRAERSLPTEPGASAEEASGSQDPLPPPAPLEVERDQEPLPDLDLLPLTYDFRTLRHPIPVVQAARPAPAVPPLTSDSAVWMGDPNRAPASAGARRAAGASGEVPEPARDPALVGTWFYTAGTGEEDALYHWFKVLRPDGTLLEGVGDPRRLPADLSDSAAGAGELPDFEVLHWSTRKHRLHYRPPEPAAYRFDYRYRLHQDWLILFDGNGKKHYFKKYRE